MFQVFLLLMSRGMCCCDISHGESGNMINLRGEPVRVLAHAESTAAASV